MTKVRGARLLTSDYPTLSCRRCHVSLLKRRSDAPTLAEEDDTFYYRRAYDVATGTFITVAEAPAAAATAAAEEEAEAAAAAAAEVAAVQPDITPADTVPLETETAAAPATTDKAEHATKADAARRKQPGQAARLTALEIQVQELQLHNEALTEQVASQAETMSQLATALASVQALLAHLDAPSHGSSLSATRPCTPLPMQVDP